MNKLLILISACIFMSCKGNSYKASTSDSIAQQTIRTTDTTANSSNTNHDLDNLDTTNKQTNNNETIQAQLGKKFQIKLPQTPSEGSRWDIVQAEKKIA